MTWYLKYERAVLRGRAPDIAPAPQPPAMVQLARDASTPAPVIPARVTAGTVLRSVWRALGRLR